MSRGRGVSGWGEDGEGIRCVNKWGPSLEADQWAPGKDWEDKKRVRRTTVPPGSHPDKVWVKWPTAR